MQRAPALVGAEVDAGDIADRQTVVTEVPVCRSDSGDAVLHLHAIDQDLAVDHPFPTVILHVHTVEARLGINVAHGDVLAAVRHLDRPAQLRSVASDVLDHQMTHEEALVPPAADRYDIADRVPGGQVPQHPMLNVPVLRHGGDHHSVLGAVVGLSVLNDEPATSDQYERSAVRLLHAVAVAFQRELADPDLLRQHLDDRCLGQSGLEAHVEPDERNRLLNADSLGDLDLTASIRHQNRMGRCLGHCLLKGAGVNADEVRRTGRTARCDRRHDQSDRDPESFHGRPRRM